MEQGLLWTLRLSSSVILSWNKNSQNKELNIWESNFSAIRSWNLQMTYYWPLSGSVRKTMAKTKWKSMQSVAEFITSQKLHEHSNKISPFGKTCFIREHVPYCVLAMLAVYSIPYTKDLVRNLHLYLKYIPCLRED